eukprot:1148164-Pelagomonas_calceolata.AAC.4
MQAGNTCDGDACMDTEQHCTCRAEVSDIPYAAAGKEWMHGLKILLDKFGQVWPIPFISGTDF